MFVFVIDFVFGTQLSLVEQTLIVYQAQTQTLGYETGFEHKKLCLCRLTQTVFVFSERSQFQMVDRTVKTQKHSGGSTDCSAVGFNFQLMMRPCRSVLKNTKYLSYSEYNVPGTSTLYY